MRTVDPGNCFTSWRAVARRLLTEGVPPGQVIWDREASLFSGLGEEIRTYETPRRGSATVPKAFVELARSVACHRDPARWALLYRILYRISRGRERSLTSISSDPDIARARTMAKNVRREIHKMHAFVRFRKVGETDTGREEFVAWFEPDHFIVEAAAPFFRKRFANMDWAILTPKGCVQWDGNELAFGEGIERDPFSGSDSMEEAWRTYYRSIFNPARLKTKAMQAEMPKRYWKNLPEADLIEDLVRHGRYRTQDMIETPPSPVRPEPPIPYLRKLRHQTDSPSGD